MTAHLCATFDATCYRCDLASDEFVNDNCLQCGESHPGELRHQWPCKGRSNERCVHPSCKPDSQGSSS